MRSVFDLQTEPDRTRYDAWHSALAETFVSLDCHLPDRRISDGKIASVASGDVFFTHVSTVGQVVHRTSRLIARDDAEVILISCQLSGECIVSQDGREAQLKPGDFALYDSTRPYSLSFDDSFNQLVFHMPRQVLRQRVTSCRRFTAKRFRAETPSIAAASGFLEGVGNQFASFRPEAALGLSKIALDLVSHSILDLLSDTGSTASSNGLTIRHKAMNAIDQNFSDPEFSTPALARIAGVSTRRVQEVFALFGDSPMECIWERRVQHSAAALSDPLNRHKSVTDIGYESGFADSSQFSRRFRRRFDMAPTQWRLRQTVGQSNT